MFMETLKTKRSWKESLELLFKPSVLTMLFLGFSAGIPLLLIFSSLSLWLREAGVSRSEVTFFSWAALGFSFKFIWAPLVDRLPIPWLTKKLGRRRSWLLLSQSAIAGSILIMGFSNPSNSSSALVTMAIGAVLLGFSAATQDIVVDAFRIESESDKDIQAYMAATYIAGYRVGMITSGAGALFLASLLGSSKENYVYSAWSWTYVIMASTMLIGILTTLFAREPQLQKPQERHYATKDYTKLFALFLVGVLGFIGTFLLTKDLAQSLQKELSASLNEGLVSFVLETCRLLLGLSTSILIVKTIVQSRIINKNLVDETYIHPVRDFFERYGTSVSILLLSLIGLYRISDIILGVISTVFYQDLGFSKNEIASVVKTFGLVMTILGGFLGGALTVRYGVMRVLFLGALLSAATNLLFMALASIGHNMPALYVVISADNLSAGLATTAFVAFLSSLTNVSFTAMQYAIFSSLMTLFPKLLGGYSGTLVDSIGYSGFFACTAIAGIPVLFLVLLAAQKLEIDKPL